MWNIIGAQNYGAFEPFSLKIVYFYFKSRIASYVYILFKRTAGYIN